MNDTLSKMVRFMRESRDPSVPKDAAFFERKAEAFRAIAIESRGRDDESLAERAERSAARARARAFELRATAREARP